MTTYTWDLLLSNITVVVFFFILLQVWTFTISPDDLGQAGGENFSWNQLIWFLAGGQVLFYAVQTEAQLKIEEDVLSGNIVVTLTRPYDYLTAQFSATLAYIFLSFVVTFPIAFLIAWIASGTIVVSIWGIILFCLAFVMRTVIFFALQAIAGLATFWIEKATAFVWILGLLIFTFGGGAVPLGFWPDTARSIVEFTPFPVMMYYPALILVDPEPTLVLETFGKGLLWIAILGGAVALIYRKALGRLELNGG